MSTKPNKTPPTNPPFKKKRDYKAEYERRIARAEQLAKKSGIEITRSQARGHARKAKNEVPISALQSIGSLTTTSTPVLQKYDAVIKRMSTGQSLTAATKAEKMSPKTFKTLAIKNNDLKAHNLRGRLEIAKRWFDVITSDGIHHKQVLLNMENASHAGTYWNAVRTSNQGDTSLLNNLTHKTITDVYGNSYELLTDHSKLVELGYASLSDGDEPGKTSKIYRIG